MKTLVFALAGAAGLSPHARGSASELKLTIQADKPGAKINEAMWGIFFEDINLGADGGLYAELVKNRSFEFPDGLMGWKAVTPEKGTGSLAVLDEKPLNASNPHFVRITSATAAGYGVSNEGFRGMGIRAGDTYNFSVAARNAGAGQPALRLELIGGNGRVLASAHLKGFGSGWGTHTAALRGDATEPKARLNLILEGAGALDLDMVSLFPENTWKHRPGGLRADMVQMLADLKPGFLRFPGGCIVEGSQLDRRYQWKNTLGDPTERKLLINRWNYEFKHRLTPDYFQTFGLGFFEFFQLCEDIGAQPLPILNCGMACQFNTGELVPLDQLDPYIQDALDLIEFANGPAGSPWGARRAAMGHLQPFNLRLLGVGNEQWGPQYVERYVRFAKALKERYPGVQLISSAGPSPADDRFDFLWPKLRELKADIVDEHCYANPIWFLANAHRYDRYDRGGPKVFMGEYAAQSVAIVSPNNQNNLECALAEAAYMTGLERNADVVRMASYAPLFAHVDGWQWTPNLIWTDNLRVYGTPNYYVQQLFCRNRGDVVLPVGLEGADLPGSAAGQIGLGTSQSTAEFKDVRVTRGNETLLVSDFEESARGWAGGKTWIIKQGAYRQTDPRSNSPALAGDVGWGDYTLSLKARKLGGSGGFQVRVRQSGPEQYVVWNLGDDHNSANALVFHLGQQDQVLARAFGSIEEGRWYDVKIELRGSKVTCSLDGQLVHSAEAPAPQTQRIYASAARDSAAGEIIVKVVNPGSAASEARLEIAGAGGIASEANAIVLTGSDGAAVNSLDAPRNVAPVESKIEVTGAQFVHNFPARSMSVLRIKTK